MLRQCMLGIAVAALVSTCKAFTVPRGGWGMERRMIALPASQSTQLPPVTTPPQSEALLASLVAAAEADDGTLAATIQQSYDQLGQREMIAMSARASKADDTTAASKSWEQVLEAIESETRRRMSTAKERLEKLMEAGEINELDRRLSKMVRESEIDPAFLTVLNTNLEAAKAAEEAAAKNGTEANVSLFNIYQHISSRVQEELEKKTSPEFALLHKLMRTDDAGLRQRILGHYLQPQREILMPDTTVIPLDKPKPARVAPMAFSGAVQQLVATLRGLDVNGDTVVETIEAAREVAKEARLIIAEEELYEADLLDEFTQSLVSAFGGASA